MNISIPQFLTSNFLSNHLQQGPSKTEISNLTEAPIKKEKKNQIAQIL